MSASYLLLLGLLLVATPAILLARLLAQPHNAFGSPALSEAVRIRLLRQRRLKAVLLMAIVIGVVMQIVFLLTLGP